jgi:GNAT superfamily N-acetyltransferase
MTPDATPEGYPSELERWLTLPDGRRVFIRPVVAADAAQLGRELLRADPETVYQRFFRSPVRLDAEQLERLTDVDYVTRLALAAFGEDGEGAAIARFEPEGPGVAEVAVVVRPEWRRNGLASAMLEMLEQVGRRSGIRRFTALHLSENVAIAAVLTHLGFTRLREEGGVVTSFKDLAAS